MLVHLTLVACWPGYVVAKEPDGCEYFFSVLKPVPHHRLTRNDGVHDSLWDGKKYLGCEIRFVTNDKLLSGNGVPNFDANKGSEMYRRGWRINNSYVADGPGTGSYGVAKKSVLCIFSNEQPAYLEDHGNIIQSEAMSITVQCRYR